MFAFNNKIKNARLPGLNTFVLSDISLISIPNIHTFLFLDKKHYIALLLHFKGIEVYASRLYHIVLISSIAFYDTRNPIYEPNIVFFSYVVHFNRRKGLQLCIMSTTYSVAYPISGRSSLLLSCL